MLYREWFTLYVTAAGTSLAHESGAFPQWVEEKLGTRKLKRNQNFILTEGKGAHNTLLILGCKDSIDLEALAGPQRSLRNPCRAPNAPSLHCGDMRFTNGGSAVLGNHRMTTRGIVWAHSPRSVCSTQHMARCSSWISLDCDWAAKRAHTNTPSCIAPQGQRQYDDTSGYNL